MQKEARYFLTAEEMSEYQAERETDEAIRFSLMNSEDKMRWLEQNWNPLQAMGTLLWAGYPFGEHTVRYFSSFEEKNKFDDDRELDIAMYQQTKFLPKSK